MSKLPWIIQEITPTMDACQYPSRIKNMSFAWYLSGINLYGVEFEEKNGKENPYCLKTFRWGAGSHQMKDPYGYDFSEAKLKLGRYEKTGHNFFGQWRFIQEELVDVKSFEEATEKLIQFFESKKG